MPAKKVCKITVNWYVKYTWVADQWLHHQSPSFFKEYLWWKCQLLQCVELEVPDNSATPTRSLKAYEILHISDWKYLEVKFFRWKTYMNPSLISCSIFISIWIIVFFPLLRFFTLVVSFYRHWKKRDTNLESSVCWIRQVWLKRTAKQYG